MIAVRRLSRAVLFCLKLSQSHLCLCSDILIFLNSVNVLNLSVTKLQALTPYLAFCSCLSVTS